MNRILEPKEVEKRIKTWADVTVLSLELKRAALRKRNPELVEKEISKLVQRELSMLKIKKNE
ncbi:MAG: hypothetical protein FJ243_02375 [Nitrospira sp.]|nr:hypothetical protein [Nitrospira sp.]